MIEDKYLYSLIRAKKKDTVLKLLYYFFNKSNNYRVVLYNTNQTIININDDYLKHLLNVIAGIKKDVNIYPCYLELLKDSTVIFSIDMEECLAEYFDDYNREYINYIVSLVGKIENISDNSEELNSLMLNVELVLQNKINHFKAVEKWGVDKVLPYDEKQLNNLFNTKYNILFNLYPADILYKINAFRNGVINEQYFEDIVYQNVLIKVSLASYE